MEVKPSKALNKAKLFMESVKVEEQEYQDKEQTTIEQFNSLTRTENKMPTGGVSDSSSAESDSSDSSDEEPSSVVRKGQEGKGLHGLSPFLHVVFFFFSFKQHWRFKDFLDLGGEGGTYYLNNFPENCMKMK